MIAAFRGRFKRLLRRALDPLLDAQTVEIERRISQQLNAARPAESEPVPIETSPLLADFNHALHELRTIELRRLPIDGGVLLSAGCAGSWYFDWLEECAGPFREHIGVELYSPKPDALPANVRWIAQSASDMSAVGDGSVDLVYSGQNLEHLWQDDMVGFLIEARRVLRPGGALVVDSPNRLVTEALAWSHPEHTIELSIAEARELLEVAGFDVVVERGLWNCRDQRTSAWLPLGSRSLSDTFTRCIERRPVDHDFVWWIEAVRSERTAEPDGVRALVAKLFADHWHTRINRVAVCTGHHEAGRGWSLPAGATGLVYRTWGFPIFAGRFEARSPHPDLRLRLIAPDGTVLADALGGVDDVVETTTFGVIAELIADEALSSDVAHLDVALTQYPARHSP